MIDKKLIYILFSFLALLSVVFLSLLSPKQAPNINNFPLNAVTPTPTVVDNEPFRIINVLPTEDKSILRPPIQQVAIVFNRPILQKDLVYKVSPFVKTSLRQDETNTLIIYSEDGWIPGKTIITVLKESKDTNGNNLLKDTSYQFMSGFEQKPILNSPDY